MNHTIQCKSSNGSCKLADDKIVFHSNGDYTEAFFNMAISFPEWTDNWYVMMPACAYNGNRQKRIVRKYPPMYLPEEAGVHCDHLMTNVPALEPDGSGSIQVTAGDMAVPCVGIFARELSEGFFLFTEQEVKGTNIGFKLERGLLEVSFPANRSDLYRWCAEHPTSGDRGISVTEGEEISSRFKIYTFPCADMAEFYKKFFEVRKSVMSSPRAPFAYTKELWELVEYHFNDANFSGEYYAEAQHVWQPGWVGGGMSTYPLLKYGSELSKQRARRTIDYLAAHQGSSGFYYGIINKGVILDDSFRTPGMEGLHLIRKSADILYYFYKNISATEPKKEWIESAKKCADAFVKLFETYGTFGQFVNVESGEMIVGGTFSGAIAPAALAKSWEYFGDEVYLTTARAALEHYMSEFMRTGVTNGGPGEILSAPDSESAFALLESCVVLYEIDKEQKWLDYAEIVAQYCSSWVVTYSYQFPEGSEFHRLGINTVGSIFANVQNKHSAPGICTFSGDSLLKIYRFTGKKEYLDLIKDIAYFLPQCVSTNERPIYTYDNPPRKLPHGYINERVNMSDWEGFECVGGVFYGTCWCETSLSMSFAELMIHDEMIEK